MMKNLKITLAALMLAVVLSACPGPKKAESTEAPAEATTPEATTTTPETHQSQAAEPAKDSVKGEETTAPHSEGKAKEPASATPEKKK